MKSFIKLTDLSKIYFSKGKVVKHALRSVSLEIQEGEVLGLLGVNGAGKTTLVSLLSTLHPPSSGDIEWKGESIYNDLLNYRALIGLCPQHPNLEEGLSLGQILTLSGRCYGMTKKEAAEKKDELLKEFKLEQYEDLHSSQLSGGYRQRFLIARALMHSPKLLILDEPTVGLDSHIRRELWGVIRGLRSKGISVLLTTHYLDEAEQLSDRICLLHEGSLRTIDTPENLKKRHKKTNLEEVFLKFVDDPDAEIFNSYEVPT